MVIINIMVIMIVMVTIMVMRIIIMEVINIMVIIKIMLIIIITRLRSKAFSLDKILAKLGLKCQKHFWVKKEFWSKKILKECCPKNLGLKIFLVIIIIRSDKNFEPEKYFESGTWVWFMFILII